MQNRCVKWPRKVFWGRKLSSNLTLKTKRYHSRGCCDNSCICEQLKKRVTDKHFEKKLDFEPESASVTGKVCYHYNSWVSGVYTCGVHISHKLRRKNISDWVIMWIKFKAVIRKSQNKALRLLNFKHSMESSNPMYKEMHILKLEDVLL